jgi:hypothetical protein
MCVNVTCPAPRECEETAGACDHATGVCGSAPSKANGTVCTIGSCQGGVCTGGGRAEPRCRLCGLFGFDHSRIEQADSRQSNIYTPNADMCVGVTCPPAGECLRRYRVCKHATGVCDAPPKANGTLCSIGSCQGGVCTGGAGLSRTVAYTVRADLITPALNELTDAKANIYPHQTQICAPASHVLRRGSARKLPACATMPRGCAAQCHLRQTARSAVSAPARVACAQVWAGLMSRAVGCVVCSGLITSPATTHMTHGNPTFTPRNADMCVGVTCTEPGECEETAGACNHATGVCVGLPKANGTLCSIGSCQGGVCKGGVVHVAAAALLVSNPKP